MSIKAFLALAVVLAALSPGGTATHHSVESIPGCPDTTPQGTHGFVRYGQRFEDAPDFIAVAGIGSDTGGYVNRDRFIHNRSNDPLPVCNESLTTTVGHWYPGRGFVPLGVNPETIPNTVRCYGSGSGDGSVLSGPTKC